MMRIEHHAGRSCPFVYCDVCRRSIVDTSLAMAAWRWRSGRIYHVHKGACLAILEAGASLCTEELRAHLLHVLANHLPEAAPLIEADGWQTDLRPEARRLANQLQAAQGGVGEISMVAKPWTARRPSREKIMPKSI